MPRSRHTHRRTGWVRLFLPLSLVAVTLLLLLPTRRTAQQPEPTPTLPDSASVRAACATLNTRLIDEINQVATEVNHLEILPSGEDGVLVTNWPEIIARSAVTGEPLETLFPQMVQLQIKGTGTTDLFFPSADGTVPLATPPLEQPLPQLIVSCEASGALRKLSQKEQAQVSNLLDPSEVEVWKVLLAGPSTAAPTLNSALPPIRHDFVGAAWSLVGKVGYFWGGKSVEVGWDLRWGMPALVVASGISDSGTVMPYGLDCSGLISWAAVTAAKDPSAYAAVGDGVRAQYASCTTVDWAEIQPGDLLFFPDLSHIGIAVGWTEARTVQAVHCSHSLGGVVLSQDAAQTGFTLAGTPDRLFSHANSVIFDT